jgi:hypothetical protein
VVKTPQQICPVAQSDFCWQWNAAVNAGHVALVPGMHCPVAWPPAPTPTQQVFALRSHGVVPQMGTPESAPEPAPESGAAEPDDPPESIVAPELLELLELPDPDPDPLEAPDEELLDPPELLEPPTGPAAAASSPNPGLDPPPHAGSESPTGRTRAKANLTNGTRRIIGRAVSMPASKRGAAVMGCGELVFCSSRACRRRALVRDPRRCACDPRCPHARIDARVMRKDLRSSAPPYVARQTRRKIAPQSLAPSVNAHHSEAECQTMRFRASRGIKTWRSAQATMRGAWRKNQT